MKKKLLLLLFAGALLHMGCEKQITEPEKTGVRSVSLISEKSWDDTFTNWEGFKASAGI